MRRSKLREQVFLLLFRMPFHTEEEMEEQTSIYLVPQQDAHAEDIDGFSAVTDEDEAALFDLTEKDTKKVTERFQDVCEHLEEIDEMLTQKTSGWDIKRIGKVELAILRLAVYEIRFDETVPDAVAINEAVELAKKFGQDSSASFVNGVLAKFA
ncbi:MAG: transcription antitermination factor NusB [Lachnospiraceae bacterium]|nr:transcription antitermination factor NusB [Lachnospiraceae bacterium]